MVNLMVNAVALVTISFGRVLPHLLKEVSQTFKYQAVKIYTEVARKEK